MSSCPITFKLDFLTFHPRGACSNRPHQRRLPVFCWGATVSLTHVLRVKVCVCAVLSFLSPGRLSWSCDIKAIAWLGGGCFVYPELVFMPSVTGSRPSGGRDGGGREETQGRDEERSNSRWGFIRWTREVARVTEWEVFCCVCVSLLAEIS